MFIMGQTMEEILLSRETGEVHFESSSGNRVPRGSNKLFQDMSVFITGESVRRNLESVSGYLCQRSGDS